jgi:hypothetical protein
MEKREDGRYVFPEGKYVMIKMPNRPLLSVFQVLLTQNSLASSTLFAFLLTFFCSGAG